MAGKPKFDGPIPGANYTSNTKNYPWHRPPDHPDIDELIENMIASFDDPEKASVFLSLIENGDTILDFVTGMLRVGVGNGKMTIDSAIVLAGPMAKMAELVADKAGVKYERGYDPKPKIMTGARMRAYEGSGEPETPPDGAPMPDDPPAPETPPAPRGGLMGAVEPSQDEMLGRKE